MAIRSIQELQDAASGFREMATTGSDIKLREALLLVAEEFEREAARLEGTTIQAGGMT
jgi:hypothetical protein